MRYTSEKLGVGDKDNRHLQHIKILNQLLLIDSKFSLEIWARLSDSLT